MKRIIGVSLAILLAFAAIGTLQPPEASASSCSSSAYNAIFCYFDGEIDKDQLESILNGLGITLVRDETHINGGTPTTTTRVTTVSVPGTGPDPDPYRPRDLTPWAMIEQYAANQNAANPPYCATTVSVTLPSNIQTYGGQTFTVKNLWHNAAYCSALLNWEAIKDYDYYVDEDGNPNPPPRPRVEDYQ